MKLYILNREELREDCASEQRRCRPTSDVRVVLEFV